MIKTVTSNIYTIERSDLLIKCNCSSNSIAITLQNSSKYENGRAITIRKVDATTNTVTISTSDSQTIDTDTSITFTGFNEFITIVPTNDGFGIVDSSEDNDTITWRDEYVGGVYFTPNGANAPDEVNATIGGVVTKKYAFDGSNTTEKLGNTFEIAHDVAIDLVNDGTLSLEQHIHFAASDANAGDVKFTIDWCYIPPFGEPIAMDATSFTYTIAESQQYYNLIDGVDLVLPTGGFDIGGLIEFTISRDPTDEADTYAHDALFYKTALHVPCRGNGSRQRYIK